MNKKPLILVATAIALLIVIVVTILVFDRKGSGEPLPVEKFQEAGSNFIGNRYQVLGRVDRQLGAKEGVGRLILLTVDGQYRLPVFIPASIDMNVDSGVQYRFQVLVRSVQDMTILEVQKMKKQ